MAKPFFEVFPTLQLHGAVHDILEQASVEKISATRRKDFLRIYLQSGRLIMKGGYLDCGERDQKAAFPKCKYGGKDL